MDTNQEERYLPWRTNTYWVTIKSQFATERGNFSHRGTVLRRSRKGQRCYALIVFLTLLRSGKQPLKTLTKFHANSQQDFRADLDSTSFHSRQMVLADADPASELLLCHIEAAQSP